MIRYCIPMWLKKPSQRAILQLKLLLAVIKPQVWAAITYFSPIAEATDRYFNYSPTGITMCPKCMRKFALCTYRDNIIHKLNLANTMEVNFNSRQIKQDGSISNYKIKNQIKICVNLFSWWWFVIYIMFSLPKPWRVWRCLCGNCFIQFNKTNIASGRSRQVYFFYSENMVYHQQQ